eukprot:snap_masked-scaffold_120-processed-gene-0.17-mRNA-1 protein AED:1.00 eAED:1.00 QI:0/-1/0/0/-1/1/1/0/175
MILKRLFSTAPRRTKIELGFRSVTPEDLMPVRKVFDDLKQSLVLNDNPDISQPANLEFMEYDLPAELKLNIKGPKSIPRRTQLITVNRSPFVNKKAREQFFLKQWIIRYDLKLETTQDLDVKEETSSFLTKLVDHFSYYEGVLIDWKFTEYGVKVQQEEILDLFLNQHKYEEKMF